MLSLTGIRFLTLMGEAGPHIQNTYARDARVYREGGEGEIHEEIDNIVYKEKATK